MSSLLGSFVCFLRSSHIQVGVNGTPASTHRGFLTLILCFPTNCEGLGECRLLSIKSHESFYLLPVFENAAEPLAPQLNPPLLHSSCCTYVHNFMCIIPTHYTWCLQIMFHAFYYSLYPGFGMCVFSQHNFWNSWSVIKYFPIVYKCSTRWVSSSSEITSSILCFLRYVWRLPLAMKGITT